MRFLIRFIEEHYKYNTSNYKSLLENLLRLKEVSPVESFLYEIFALQYLMNDNDLSVIV